MTISINYWQELKRFINHRSIGTIITRKQIQNLFSQYLERKPFYGYSFDKYRRYLTILEVLEHVGRGRYKINNHIPDYYNSKNIQKMSQRSHFLDKISRSLIQE